MLAAQARVAQEIGDDQVQPVGFGEHDLK